MPHIAIRDPGRSQIVIDDNYSNLALREKKTIAVNVNTPATTTVVNIDIKGGFPPVIAIKPNSSDFYCTIGAVEVKSSSIIDYQIVGGRISGSGSTRDVTLYVFDRPDELGSPIGPLIIRNRVTGEITFDSGRKYMRVVSFLNSATNAHGTYGFGGKELAAVMGVQAREIHLYGGTGAHADLLQSSVSLTGSSLVIDWRTYEFGSTHSGSPLILISKGAATMILDVTGY